MCARDIRPLGRAGRPKAGRPVKKQVRVGELPRELPKLRVDEKTYYFDARLRELRNVENPHDTIRLDEPSTVLVAWLLRLGLARAR